MATTNERKPMSNIVTIRVDVTLIEKSRLFPGKKKNKKNLMPQYLDLVLIPTKPSNFGDWRDEQTHLVKQSISKEEREAGVRGEIIGNATEKVGDRDRREPAAPRSNAPDQGEWQPPF